MPFAFIGLGSNIEPRLENVILALEKLNNFVKIIKTSNLYETEPWGNQNLNPFINGVAKIETDLEPLDLLILLLNIEKQLGRVRTQKWDNRTIDLDLLDYENIEMNAKELILPHPYIQERNFVIIPWYEIEPEWILSNKLKIKDLYFRFYSNQVFKLIKKSPLL
jgi:2-amino-4-hydroxy-6-hydroxymethyldihydropteridine diphosphokinase